MPICLIGLGANLDDRHAMLRRAVELLGQCDGVQVLETSRWRETRAVGGPVGQPCYLNGVVTLDTSLAPNTLLAVLHDIENRLGRRRSRRWEARAIDLDLLLHGDRVENSSSLVLPHPRMAWRRFVLEPASEIAPAMVHPVLGRSISELLAHLDATPPYVAVTGVVAAANAHLVRRLGELGAVEALLGPPTSRPKHARRHDDSSGRDLAVGLECLRRRARLVRADEPRWSRIGGYVVTDFWLDASQAWARHRLAPRARACFLRSCERLARRVVRPRMVVVVDLPARRAFERFSRPSAMQSRGGVAVMIKQRQQALDRQLRRSHDGPVLRVVDPESPEAIDEIVAAMQAME